MATPATLPPTSASKATKLRAYVVIKALREGNYPNNSQLLRFLETIRQHHFVTAPPTIADRVGEGDGVGPPRSISEEGKLLAGNFDAILETLESFVPDKNADELVQEFLWHTREIDITSTKESVGKKADEAIEGLHEESQGDAQDALKHLRAIGRLILTNAEFRKLLTDAGTVGMDVVADAAVKVAAAARPNDAALEKVDQPAPSDQWVGPSGEVKGRDESAPHSGFSLDKGKEAVHAMTEPEAAKEQLNRLKGYAVDKFPEERRQRFIYRLKKVVVENQRHKDYQGAIEFFLTLLERYSDTIVASATDPNGEAVKTFGPPDPAFQHSLGELRTLGERFANGNSMKPLLNSIQEIYKAVAVDEDLRRWFSDLDKYVRRVLIEPGFIMKESSDKEGKELLKRGQEFWTPADTTLPTNGDPATNHAPQLLVTIEGKERGRYAMLKNDLFSSTETFFSGFSQDPLNQELVTRVFKLFRDLFKDREGSWKFKKMLWNDVREIFLPAIIEELGEVPVPRIEYSDHQVDVVIENLALPCQKLLPNVVEVDIHNHFGFSSRGSTTDKASHSLAIAFSEIQTDLKDVAFYVKKKLGFPRIMDEGVIDLYIGRKGISGKVVVQSVGEGEAGTFKVVSVKVKIDKLNFRVRNSSHTILIKTLKPLLTAIIKKAVAHAIEEAIRSGLEELDKALVMFGEEVEDEGIVEAIKETAAPADAPPSSATTHEDKGQFQISLTRQSKLVKWQSKDPIVERDMAFTETAVVTGLNVKGPASKGMEEGGGRSATFDSAGKAAM